jgi:hypothetical protein
MRYLSLALFAEGPSDRGFLSRIIYRSVVEIGTHLSGQQLDVGERFVEGNPWTRQDRAQRIREAFEELARQGAVNLLFIHTDGAGDPLGARATRVDPAIRLLAAANPDGFQCIAVIPVRETEAWALADPQALMDELGWTGDIQNLAVEHDLDRPEAIPDPKAALADFRRAAGGQGRRRNRFSGEAIPSGLGDRVSLQKLRQLEAFGSFERETEQALRRMWGLGN